MYNMNRREFTRKSALIGAGLEASNFVACEGTRSVRIDELNVTIPMPIQIVFDNWTVEIAIPFSDLANEHIKLVTTTTEIRINFYGLDENQGMERMSYAWSPSFARFHEPAYFGNLTFN